MWYRINIVLFLCCFVNNINALESDRQKPINIQSDRITVDHLKGFSHYQGHVILTQGTLKITGSDIKVYLENKQLHRLIIIGKPATLIQKPAEDQAEIRSRAGRMEYDVEKSMLLLTNNAEVEQGQNRFSGDYIKYNTKTSVVHARQSPDKKSRVHITIVPENETRTPEPTEEKSP